MRSGLALPVVLETLAPAERLAFVLHDVFAVPFEEIAPIVERTPTAARQLASRARRRVRGAAAEPDADLTRQREVVDAFLAASRGGDFEALLAVLDPDVVLRLDRGAVPALRGSPRRAGRGRAEGHVRCAWLDGASGAGERRRRRDHRAPRPAGLGDGLHGQAREDRRHRHPRRSGASPSARAPRPAGRTLTRRCSATSLAVLLGHLPGPGRRRARSADAGLPPRQSGDRRRAPDRQGQRAPALQRPAPARGVRAERRGRSPVRVAPQGGAPPEPGR